jgi:glucuronokinase
MQRIVTTAHARAALAGNPSDGYFGKTLSYTMRDFSASCVLYEWPVLEILPGAEDHARFDSLEELSQDVRRFGYYGGARLVKASLKRFHDLCLQRGVELPKRNFSIRYETNVPRGVGMAGSSAIITAAFRALSQFFEVEIAPHELANWVLSVEREEIGIQGGLQDRVAQAYGGVIFMDFARDKMERDGFGTYEKLDPAILPPLYLAYQTEWAETSDVVHNDLRARWERGNAVVHETMHELGENAVAARDALLRNDVARLHEIIDHNFELRRRIVPIQKQHEQMIAGARSCGASAHFTGSGGAITGVCQSEEDYARLQQTLGEIGCRVLRPKIG